MIHVRAVARDQASEIKHSSSRLAVNQKLLRGGDKVSVFVRENCCRLSMTFVEAL